MRLARRGRAWYTEDKNIRALPQRGRHSKKGEGQMRAEREKLNAKITAGALKLSGGRLELPAEMCHIVLFSGGSCTVQCGDMSRLVSLG